MPVNLEQLRALFLAYPGVTEAPSYGTPGFRVRKKLLARIHQSEPAVVLRVESLDEQQMLIEMKPRAFYITDHYITDNGAGHAMVLARMSTVPKSMVREIFEAAWRRNASNRQLAEFEA